MWCKSLLRSHWLKKLPLLQCLVSTTTQRECKQKYMSKSFYVEWTLFKWGHHFQKMCEVGKINSWYLMLICPMFDVNEKATRRYKYIRAHKSDLQNLLVPSHMLSPSRNFWILHHRCLSSPFISFCFCICLCICLCICFCIWVFVRIWIVDIMGF